MLLPVLASLADSLGSVVLFSITRLVFLCSFQCHWLSEFVFVRMLMYDGAKECVSSPESTLARQLHESLRGLPTLLWDPLLLKV